MEQTSEATGETEVAAVVVSRTLLLPGENRLGSPHDDRRLRSLLGPGAQLGSKGESWRSHDGREGVVRSFHPLEQIRFTWRLRESAHPTMVDVRLVPADDQATEFRIEHSKLPPHADRAWLSDRWEAAIDRIESECV